MRAIILSLLLGTVATGMVAGGAAAQGHRRVVVIADNDLQSLPLTVNRRSWLDPGNAVSNGGSGPAYVSASTQFSKTPDRVFAPDKFGNDTLQGQPYVPGRTVPVVSFSTTPDNRAVVDNVLHYQPY